MVIKPRSESKELKLYRVLNIRMDLSDEEVQYYWSLEKGFEGEIQFDAWLNDLPGSENWLILNDLLLEYNRTTFQIDSLLLADETLFFFEIKNFEGDFFIDENGRWLTLANKEIKNPLLQLERSKSLLRQLLQSLGMKVAIKSNIIFINPHFQLYQAPLGQPIIFPTQLKRFSKQLPVKLANRKCRQTAEKLVSIHLKESPYKRLPKYTYEQLKKGIICKSCHSRELQYQDYILICTKCSCKEDVRSSIIRSVEEFILLFPERKVTTNAIFEWCEVIKSKKVIRKLLLENYTCIGYGKSSYYVDL
ncbi:nuclease-related domain-containing protein [Cytobacillus praedii]|uniref:nuclease-related domain-containing protein n=1 Tax=Cytobacillus praedii TaxID=1742358 RepID=UPI002E207C4C|nr:nuclease-related domain-containing protein [Cytobacillus praedii]